ncbi:MAG: T9SS type A sorting domain-containing protein, partial [Bacteroidia bacterium]
FVNDYNQKNDYYNVPWSPYFQKRHFVPSENANYLNPWEYRHYYVMSQAFDGAYGTASVIPSNGGTNGNTYSKSFSLTINSSTNTAYQYNPDNMYIVAYVSEADTINANNRAVLNAVISKVTANSELIGIKERRVEQGLVIYPNPADEWIRINVGNKEKVKVRLYSMLGQEMSIKLFEGDSVIEINTEDLNNGIYFLGVEQDRQKQTQKIIVRHE